MTGYSDPFDSYLLLESLLQLEDGWRDHRLDHMDDLWWRMTDEERARIEMRPVESAVVAAALAGAVAAS